MARKNPLFALLMLLAISAPLSAHAACSLGKLGELPVSMRDKQPIVTVQINGQDIHLIADSGAFFSLLTKARAKQLGLPVTPAPYGMKMWGVGGEVDGMMTTTKHFSLLGYNFPSVDFLVGADNILTGDISGLLGQNILSTQDIEFDLANGVIRLFKEHDCRDQNMAYWANASASVNVIAVSPISNTSFHLVGEAKVNGHRVSVLFDTGAGPSVIKLNIAAWLGLTPKSPGAVPSDIASGIGRRRIETWTVPVKNFELGDEKITNTRLRIGDITLDEDMLIGSDFFLSHHIYYSYNQNRLYFTYNGGAVFDLTTRPNMGSDQKIASADPSASRSWQPKTAAEFARRGEAKLARGQYTQAIIDLDQAIDLDPQSAEDFIERAKAHLGLQQTPLALADVDRALTLKPNDLHARMMRGKLRLEAHDLAGAQSDFAAADAGDDGDTSVGLEIAAAYEEADQFALAVAEDNKWMKDHPTDDRLVDAIAGRCWTYTLWNRELDTALKDCNRAVRMSEGDHSSLDSRGLLHLRLGQWDAAIRDYNAALWLQPKSAWSLYGRGVAKIHEGEISSARADLKLSAEIDPKVAERAAKLGFSPTPTP